MQAQVFTLAGKLLCTVASDMGEQDVLKKAQAECPWYTVRRVFNEVLLAEVSMMNTGFQTIVAKGLYWAAQYNRLGDAVLVKRGRDTFILGSPRCGSPSSDSVSHLDMDLVGVRDLAATRGAFLAIKFDGTVVVWGDEGHGGAPGPLLNELYDVEKCAATEAAFAVVRADGSVRAWGSPVCGGDCTMIQHLLQKKVQLLRASKRSFAAWLADWSVLVWTGSNDWMQLQGIPDPELVPNNDGFAAVYRDPDRRAMTFSLRRSSATSCRAKHVVKVLPTASGFVFLIQDPNTQVWDVQASGDMTNPNYGFARFRESLQGLDIQADKCESNPYSVAIVARDRAGRTSVQTCGHEKYGGDSSSPVSAGGASPLSLRDLEEVLQLVQTGRAYAAIVRDRNGSLRPVTWGDERSGGDWRWAKNVVDERIEDQELATLLSQAVLYRNQSSFTADAGETVWCWGDPVCTENFVWKKREIEKQGGVRQICPAAQAWFVSTRNTNTLESWGNAAMGGGISWTH